MICTGCGLDKPHKARQLCRACYEKQPDVRAKKNERWKAKYRVNAEFRERARAHSKASQFKHYDAVIDRNKRFAIENPDVVRARQARWRKKIKAETGVAHSAKYKPGRTRVAISKWRLYGTVNSVAKRIDGEFTVDVKLDNGNVLEAVPVRIIRVVG